MKRAITQDDWKRSQIRMPQDKYDEIMGYAKNNNLSFNSAVLELLDKALNSESQKRGGLNLIEEKDDRLYRKEIYNQIKELDFIKELEKEYEEKLDVRKMRVEYLDVFGQCHVYLDFEDHFAMRNASGEWRHANAFECCDMTNGILDGMQTLD